MQLDKELDYLKQLLLKMADSVEKNIIDAFKVYQSEMEVYAINDEVVDQYERLIEELCLNIMIKERPYARDLRLVSGVMKLISDLERIGDHAEDIMELNIKLSKYERVHLPEVDEMVLHALSMIKSVITSFVKMDLKLANSVITKDEEVDEIFTNILLRLSSNVPKSKDEVSLVIYTTLLVKYIERIADHAVNIAEWVVYIINGYHKDRKI